MVGGSPQGSWNGRNSYIKSSDDNADHVPLEDQYKYCDDLLILELLMIGTLLTHITYIEDLVHIYKMYIRSRLEYNSVVFHSSLTQQQSNTLDRCQAVCLKIILQEMFISHLAACEMLGLEKLSICREKRCLDYAKKKCTTHFQNKQMFPLNLNINDPPLDVRHREPYQVNFSHTETYRQSTIPYCQRLLNADTASKAAEDDPAG